LVRAAASADVLISGEGRLDATSLAGKVVGEALALAGPDTRRYVVAGSVALGAAALDRVETIELREVAGSLEAALADPSIALRHAARRIAAGRTSQLAHAGARAARR
jgi:glycerate kinase